MIVCWKVGALRTIKKTQKFHGGMAGDAIHYIMIGMGKSDVSHTPYTYRFLVPVTMGFCKILNKRPAR